MQRTEEEQEEFAQIMVRSHNMVHSEKYFHEINKFLENKKIDNILDIGCGPGLLLRDLSKKYDIKHIYALDLSNVMLRHVKDNLKDFEGKLTTIQQHMQQNHELPKGLDVIVSSRVLRSFEDQWAILSEIKNALKPKGLLILLDWNKDDIRTYHKFFEKRRQLNSDNQSEESIQPKEVMKFFRNFSRYNIDDWTYMLEAVGLNVKHSFAIDMVFHCVIAEKLED